MTNYYWDRYNTNATTQVTHTDASGGSFTTGYANSNYLHETLTYAWKNQINHTTNPLPSNTFTVYSDLVIVNGIYTLSGPTSTYTDIRNFTMEKYYYFLASNSSYYAFKLSQNAAMEDGRDVRIYTTSPSSNVTYTQGVYITTIQASESAYVNNARNNDGYWYVRRSIANTAPTTPSSITFSAPNGFKPGNTVNVSWGASTDAEGNLSGYNLEVYNGSSWINVANIASTSYNYTITANFSGATINFRVRAYDSAGSYSGYRTGTAQAISYNSVPTLTLATTDNRTLYENDQFNLTGQATDLDVGNVVTVKYSINGGTERAITATISQGTALTYNKVLTFKQSKLYDGTTAVTDVLADGSRHVLKVWAEDDKGGKSAEQTRVFYVVANRSAILTINPVTTVSDLLDSDTIAISGNVSDPDGNTVTVRYKIGNGLYTEVYNGTGGTFNFNVSLADLQVGVNPVTIQATDSYGLSTTKILHISKSANNRPLLKSVATYKLTPPNTSADGIVLWIQRETGDLVINAEISMGANGAAENFQTMTKTATAYVSDTIEEDEFTFDNAADAENIVVRLTMTRTSATSDASIKLISGVLS